MEVGDALQQPSLALAHYLCDCHRSAPHPSWSEEVFTIWNFNVFLRKSVVIMNDGGDVSWNLSEWQVE